MNRLLPFTCALIAVALAFVSATAQGRRDTRKEKENAELALKVHDLLKQNCWGCHGEPGKRVFGQRGGLNYMLDHEKLVARLVNKEKPEESTLYTEIAEGSMPRALVDGRPRDGKKLPQADIDLVLNWIKAGAPPWPDPNNPQDGPVWNEIKGEAPRARTEFMMCEGPRGSVVLYGGYVVEQSKSVFNGETWMFSGAKWQQASPRTSPSPSAGGAMAFDKSRNAAVLFGGLYGDPAHESTTWEWNGSNWSQSKTDAAPSARVRHAMAYDPARKAVVLFGGSARGKQLADTWLYDGRNWQQVAGSGPSAREDAAMAWDPASKSVLLYGGTASGAVGGLGDTWQFDGSEWKKLTPANQPGLRAGCAMATGSEGAVLAGGLAAGTSASECWRWDGENWVRRRGGFGARHGAGLAAEGKGGRLLLFGGTKVGRPAGDTWLLAPQK